ncbi:ATP-grasp domain-containing protein [Salipaludibacillus agaradhaerens]|uniref:ATP-grasp domain-containing protein n=1 Tax=Salipaludibacillus agaradhaerens TaxID=76935 RepID=A0A9Q4B3F1_SALAG|nr:ATP-grasp domain-containing protein [Salipaludibacillus agaradhaerens]MCR6097703.1 ATP-grasp domain-containing protein [Salipaludibacillus agaradhaerens]MCR6112813.1 ATP-grasp domain-containing protein [Salipaludibacillus agaradhaerens]
MNILLTSTARRIDFVGFFQQALKNANITGKVIVADPEDNAPSLQVGDESYIIPHQTDEQYMAAIFEICKRHKVRCLVPLNDWEVPKLSAHKRELQRLGVSVFTPDIPIVDKVRDKGKYRELLESFDVKAPRSYIHVEEAIEAIENNDVSFPLIVKPRNGSASIAIEFVNSIEEMKFAYQHAVQTIKATPLDNATYKKAEDNVIIQEVVEGEKFSVDIFNDLNGHFVTSFIRKQLEMRGGDVDRCVTVNNPELLGIAERLGKNLGHAGYINTDVYYDGSHYYVIDINPRFGGGYAFSHRAGADIPAAIIAISAGHELKKEWLTQNSHTELARHDTVVQIDKKKGKYTATAQ